MPCLSGDFLSGYGNFFVATKIQKLTIKTQTYTQLFLKCPNPLLNALKNRFTKKITIIVSFLIHMPDLYVYMTTKKLRQLLLPLKHFILLPILNTDGLFFI